MKKTRLRLPITATLPKTNGNEPPIPAYLYPAGEAALTKNFMRHAARGNLAALRRTLSEFYAAPSWCDETGAHALMHATRHADTCAFLLGKGAPIDHQDKQGCTALHKAAMQQHLASLYLLLEEGADTRLIDSKGKTALDYARETCPAAASLIEKENRARTLATAPARAAGCSFK